MCKVVKVDNKYIKNTIDSLVNQCEISKECLSSLLGVEVEVIENYSGELGSIGNFEKRRFNKAAIDKLLMLSIITEEEPDFKFKAFLEVLIWEHKFTTKSISKLAKVKENDVIKFLNEEYVQLEVRYRLASVIMTLRFLYKDLERKF